jgi:4-phytase/acid phosphatase
MHLRVPAAARLIAWIVVLSAGPAFAADAESDVRLVVILTRHGVRTPLLSNEELGRYSAQAWPEWPVHLGYLTPHGKQQMTLMGTYYRALLVQEGVLTGTTEKDAERVYFRSDSDQRTVETGRDLAAGMLPGAQPDMHARPNEATDPMFRPAKVPVGPIDRPRAVAEVLGRIGGDPKYVIQAYQPAFAALQQVLFGGAGVPAGRVSPLDLPAAVRPGTGDHVVDVDGSLNIALSLTDALLLEYAEGKPLPEVGWGRMTPQTLTQLLQLHALFFNLAQGTFYPAQVQGSNLASHLLRTIDQAIGGKADPGAFGTPEHKVVVLVGHDTNIINLGGMLGLGWWLPGTQMNPVLPGGALVFELRQRRADRQYVVRTYYVSQTLEQTRELTPLTLENPPAVAPIFIPDCSEPGPGYDAPLDRFEKLFRRVIDPNFVLPGVD